MGNHWAVTLDGWGWRWWWAEAMAVIKQLPTSHANTLPPPLPGDGAPASRSTYKHTHPLPLDGFTSVRIHVTPNAITHEAGTN